MQGSTTGEEAALTVQSFLSSKDKHAIESTLNELCSHAIKFATLCSLDLQSIALDRLSSIKRFDIHLNTYNNLSLTGSINLSLTGSILLTKVTHWCGFTSLPFISLLLTRSNV